MWLVGPVRGFLQEQASLTPSPECSQVFTAGQIIQMLVEANESEQLVLQVGHAWGA